MAEPDGAGQPHLSRRKFRESPLILNPLAGVPVLIVRKIMKKEAVRLMDKLNEEIASLHSIHSTYVKLFRPEESTRELLIDSDPEFFSDLYRVYLDYISVAVARLLDPEKTGRKRNLSLFTLIAMLENINPHERQRLEEDLKRCKKEAYNFTDPRNQLVSHFDYETNILGKGRCIPSFIPDEFDSFYKKISIILNDVRKILGLDPYMYEFGLVGHGHGKRLLNRLKIAKKHFEPDESGQRRSLRSLRATS